MPKIFHRNILSTAIVLCLSACATPSAITDSSKQVAVPEQWQTKSAQSQEQLPSLQLNNWLSSFNDQALNRVVALALSNNYSLKAKKSAVAISKERVIVSDATDFPELSLQLGNSRRKNVGETSNSYATNADISLDLSYEVDVWGKLSDEQSRAQLEYAAVKADYEQAELDLISDVSAAWYNLIEAQQLLALYQERSKNLQKNLEIIQAAYRLGLNDALDVYLTKNEVNQELARTEGQQQTVLEKSRALEILLGEYPNAARSSELTLPSIESEIDIGLPAQLVARRSDINATWFELMALDAGLAVAHKQRFPQFRLTGSIGDSSDDLENLLDGGSLAWSLLGNITTPLFNAGKLESLEEQARLAVEQKEQLYLQQVFQAFSDVENNLSNRQALLKRNEYFQKARDNAVAAETLSFNQYLRGLVTYTTVLESQRRAFDAQTASIQIRNTLLQNRINLFVSLGGSALDDTSNEAEQLSQIVPQDSRNLANVSPIANEAPFNKSSELSK